MDTCTSTSNTSYERTGAPAPHDPANANVDPAYDQVQQPRGGTWAVTVSLCLPEYYRGHHYKHFQAPAPEGDDPISSNLPSLPSPPLGPTRGDGETGLVGLGTCDYSVIPETSTSTVPRASKMAGMMKLAVKKPIRLPSNLQPRTPSGVWFFCYISAVHLEVGPCVRAGCRDVESGSSGSCVSLSCAWR